MIEQIKLITIELKNGFKSLGQGSIFVCLVIIFYTLLSSYTQQKIVQKKGFYNLEEKSISQEKIIKIDGYWSFYWKQIPIDTNQQFNLNFLKKEEYFSMKSSSWVEYGYPPKGYGSYRLQISLPKNAPKLMLKINRISTSCLVWINGKKIQEHGKFSSNTDSSIADGRPMYVELPEESNIDLIISVSNYHHRLGGGFVYGVHLGEKNIVLKKQNHDILLEFGLSIIMLIMVLVHLAAFLIVERKPLFIYFSIFCLSVSLRQLFVDEAVIYHLYPNISYSNVQLWRYLPVHFGPVFFTLYYKELLPKDSIKWIVNLIITVNACFLTYTLLFPTYESTYVAIFHIPFSGIVLLYTMYLITISLIKKRAFSRLIFINSLIAIICFGNDLFLASDISIIGESISDIAGIFILLLQVLINYKMIKNNTLENSFLNNKFHDIKNLVEAKNKEITSLIVESTQLIREREMLAKKINAAHKYSKNLVLTEIIAELKSDGREKERILFIRENFNTTKYELIKKITADNPTLTKIDIEICSLILLGISSREIAEMRSTSYQAVKKSRYRIRKKLQLPKNISLLEYLNRYE